MRKSKIKLLLVIAIASIGASSASGTGSRPVHRGGAMAAHVRPGK